MMEIYKILAEYNAPIHFHLDINTTEDLDALKNALNKNPNTTFVWAHTCNKKTSLATNFSNLYCETELTVNEVFGSEEARNDRMIIGSDAAVFRENASAEIQNYQFVIEHARIFLLGFTDKNIADLYAHEN